MLEALKEARKAYNKNEVPVGAVIVHQDKIIARAHNTREKSQQFFAHAEFLAMIKASKKLSSWRLEDCEVYVTMEPCPMCAGAMIQSRIKTLYYGVNDPKSGVISSMTNLFDLSFNHQIDVYSGVLEEESRVLIKDFFSKLRKK